MIHLYPTGTRKVNAAHGRATRGKVSIYYAERAAFSESAARRISTRAQKRREPFPEVDAGFVRKGGFL